MKAEDLKALRIPLLVLAVTALVVGGTVYYTTQLLQQAQVALARQTGQLREAQTRMQRSGDEKVIIVKYVDRYRQLQDAGFIGDEQRINWLDALRKANERTDLFGVNYEIGIQQDYPYGADLDRGRMTLRQSVMRVEFRLLHELDLLRFFDALRKQGIGIFHVDRCTMRRTDLTSTAVRYQPNITANCQLAWITATPEAQAAPAGARP